MDEDHGLHGQDRAMLKTVKAGDKTFNRVTMRENYMSTRRSIAALAASAVLLLSATMAAFAHAHLVRATPAAGGTVQAAPTEVTLRFSEKLEPKFSSVVVRDSAGKQVNKGDAAVDKADRTLIRVSLPSLEPGVYKVEWRAVSADTHKINGDFTFKVGE
jgi:methionine-rich copper-binding protein CopC